jgi:hypothetical protein
VNQPDVTLEVIGHQGPLNSGASGVLGPPGATVTEKKKQAILYGYRGEERGGGRGGVAPGRLV